MNSNVIIKIKNLTKTFGTNEVIMGSNMNVRQGSIYGFLGANGAGKTTIFKILTGMLTPTAGTVELFGVDITKHRCEILQQIGSMIEVPTFYEHLSAMDNLEIHLAYMGGNGLDISKVLDMVGLNGIGSKPVSKFSLGMRQRLGIARAFIHQPKILILDEPINGLDPMGIRTMRNLFVDLVQKQGMTILLSSHILNEVEPIADRVGIIVNGVVVQEVNLEQIKKQCHNSLEEYFFNIMSGGDGM